MSDQLLKRIENLEDIVHQLVCELEELAKPESVPGEFRDVTYERIDPNSKDYDVSELG